ncbi:HD2 [Hepatospora eriocheir]|uniref:HD2 n=1 Tax=Hepatospora eriocheir TaxID=1081669 RepID=A0A1X0QD02_9MICR|nr:HD2 [Hepatospora eriocheir]
MKTENSMTEEYSETFHEISRDVLKRNGNYMERKIEEIYMLINKEYSTGGDKEELLALYSELDKMKRICYIEQSMINMIDTEIDEFNAQINLVCNLRDHPPLSSISLDNYNDSNSINASELYNSQNKNKSKRSNYPKAVSKILKTWLKENMNNPYPTESEKAALMEATKLDSTQINNWFINARRRILPFMKSKFSQNY